MVSRSWRHFPTKKKPTLPIYDLAIKWFSHMWYKSSYERERYDKTSCLNFFMNGMNTFNEFFDFF